MDAGTLLRRMTTATTEGISVSVTSRFDNGGSDPRASRVLFGYHITIENRSDVAIRLLERHWKVRDALSPMRVVEGPGVVGEMPVIGPGDSYAYTSMCELRGAFGSMEGWYVVERLSDARRMRVVIPRFMLQYVHALN